MSRLRPAAAAAALLFSMFVPLAAQSHLEIEVGMGRFWPSWQGTYVHRYAPRFLNDPSAQTTGRQTLAFKAQPASGMVFGAAFFFTPRFALQLLYDSCDTEVTGTTSTHDTTATYTSMPPPDYEPRTETAAFSDDPFATGGQWTDRIISLNGLVRIALPAGFALDLSAGGSWFHADGDLGYPEYTKFWLDGQAALLSQTYALQMVFAPVDKLGWNAGAAINWSLGINAALWIEARYFGCAKIAPRVTFRNTGEITSIVAFDPAADVPPLGDLSLDLSCLRFGLGFKVFF